MSGVVAAPSGEVNVEGRREGGLGEGVFTMDTQLQKVFSVALWVVDIRSRVLGAVLFPVALCCFSVIAGPMTF